MKHIWKKLNKWFIWYDKIKFSQNAQVQYSLQQITSTSISSSLRLRLKSFQLWSKHNAKWISVAHNTKYTALQSQTIKWKFNNWQHLMKLMAKKVISLVFQLWPFIDHYKYVVFYTLSISCYDNDRCKRCAVHTSLPGFDLICP